MCIPAPDKEPPFFASLFFSFQFLHFCSKQAYLTQQLEPPLIPSHHGSFLCFRVLGHLHIRRDGLRHTACGRAARQEGCQRQRGHNAHECRACYRSTHGERERAGCLERGRKRAGEATLHSRFTRLCPLRVWEGDHDATRPCATPA